MVPIPKLEVEALKIKVGFEFNVDAGSTVGEAEKTILVDEVVVFVEMATLWADAAVPIPVSLDPSP